MRNLKYIYLEDDEAQRFVILWRPNLSRTDDSAAVCGAGRSDGTGEPRRRKCPRAGQIGTQWGTLAADSDSATAIASVTRQDLGVPKGRKTEKLKNWKSGKLTLTELARVSEFQFFTQSGPTHAGRGGGAMLNGNYREERTFPAHRKHR